MIAPMNALFTLKKIHQHTRWQWYFALLFVLLAWLAVAWFQSEAQTRSDLGEQVRQAHQTGETSANVIVKVIQQSVAHLDGIAAYLAQEPDISLALAGIPQVSPDATPAQRKQVWSNHALLMQANNHLRQAALLMGADALFVLDIHGRAIASSNADKPDSFVGTDYADRHYFQAALAGKVGRQYAMGRKTNVPGLFFSAPIRQHDQVIGVLCIKINLPRLDYWINQADAFITDDNDVVIMARDKSLEMHALSGGRIQALAPAKRDARYKRKVFPELSLQPRKELPFNDIFSVANRPTPASSARAACPT
jgi:C4-dicarboxylate-specific signal transduction histidine kinase